MAKPQEDAAPGAPEWLVTFSDLVSLLVTLFIMMLTFSTQETHDLSRAMDLIKGSFGIFRDQIRDAPDFEESPQLRANVPGGVTRFDPQADPDLETSVRELEGFVVLSEDLDRGLRIVPETKTGFAPGDDRPSPELAEELRRLGQMLRRHDRRRFRIEGHADPNSDRGSRIGDADAVALARAGRVARILGLEGVPYESTVLVSKGIRDPRGELWDESGRAANRRIEIVVEPVPVVRPEGR